MTTPLIEAVIKNYRLNLRIVRKQTAGLSHFDSLLQLPFRGNCLNWVLGHIIQGRSELLEILGKPPLWNQTDAEIYRTGSEPITPYNADTAISFEKLLENLADSQMLIEQALLECSPDDLGQLIEQDGDSSTLGEMINGYNWHETYHIGQIELLRQLAGKADSVI